MNLEWPSTHTLLCAATPIPSHAVAAHHWPKWSATCLLGGSCDRAGPLDPCTDALSSARCG